MGVFAIKLVTASLLLASSYTAFQLMFKSAPITEILFPTMATAKQNGFFPEGMPLRNAYIGSQAFDSQMTTLVGFFSQLADGKDEASRRFSLWFLAQLPPITVFMLWEAGKGQSMLTKIPTILGILYQLLTGGVVFPIYFAIYLFTVSGRRAAYPPDALPRARALPLAIILGYFVPSYALFMRPANATLLDQMQIIAAVWQAFPLWVSLVYNVASKLDASIFGTPAKIDAVTERKASRWLKGTYISLGLLAGLTHITIFLPSLAAENEALSFLEMFVPYTLRSYLSLSTMTDSPIPAYRLVVRLFFQYDWLAITSAALIFFTGATLVNRSNVRSELSFVGWVACMTLVGVLGGPGASIAWAAWMLEKSALDIERPKTA
ncbi:hypothetical protein PHLGIDRAFT_130803 [Phlebiopsis gigantea 11061_1 CR5-6]|uniref:Uncharacterized protein n=1 Tax=Phlebiopsis gigantea (strain 11061_1 CR5-6) TaxID=745531 RepID=A0A0C3NCT1_PHLG1|nr:hypothetical protein PHLGIDRAFT_130803 [Phlebiopsis gigantea 11061_1 CR5-6]